MDITFTSVFLWIAYHLIVALGAATFLGLTTLLLTRAYYNLRHYWRLRNRA